VSDRTDTNASLSPASGRCPRSGPLDGPHRRRGELHVTFVCSGNICRSPMAEKMFADQLRRRGLADAVRVTSAGTGNWHVGSGADARAARALQAHGYPTDHRAAQINDDHLAADLVVALGRNHARLLRQLGVDRDRIRMLRSFDPRSGAHVPDVEDPYYGDQDDFEEVLAVIEAALPGLHDWVDRQLAQNGHQ
jgi:protein-tyrosine phosphatase